jgi:hypothetical protein
MLQASHGVQDLHPSRRTSTLGWWAACDAAGTLEAPRKKGHTVSVQLLINVVLGLALVGYIVSKQLRWTRTDRAGVWRLPLILGIIGIISLSSSAKNLTVGTPDITIIGIELVLAVVIGLAMGRMTVFRVAQTADAKGRRIETRSGPAGAVLWIVLIVVRVGLDVVGGMMGAHLLTATGVILLTVAVSRAAAALVMDSRMPQIATVKA